MIDAYKGTIFLLFSKGIHKTKDIRFIFYTWILTGALDHNFEIYVNL